MQPKVDLTELEQQMLHQFLANRGFSVSGATSEEIDAMKSVIDKAEELMFELEAYDDINDDLLLWFYNQTQVAPFVYDDCEEDVIVMVD